MSEERSGRCFYCGRWISGENTCAEHRPLWEQDPGGGAARGVTSERELGAAEPWPAGELEDDGAPG